MDEAATFPRGRNDDQVDAMTQALNRLRASGVSFSVPESQIIVNPFEVPESWPRAFGMAITPMGVGAVWGARDDSGTVYLYAEHCLPHAEPSQNVRAIKTLGDWIPGVISPSSLKGMQADKHRIARLYRQLGLNVQISKGGEEASIYEVLQLLASNKLKVFASLSTFLAEYRIGDEQSALVLCCHALILCRDRMRTKPVKYPVPVPSTALSDALLGAAGEQEEARPFFAAQSS